MKLLTICTALLFSVEASNLPSYISKCCATDPNAEKCYRSQANKAVQMILRGDKTYNLMKLTPYMQPQLTLYNKCGVGKFYLNTCRLYGLDTIDVLSVNINFDTCKYRGCYYFDKLKFEGTYIADFKGTPFAGYGRGNIELYGVNVTHTFHFVEMKHNGCVFIPKAAVRFTATNIVYNLENLCESAEEYVQDNYKRLNELIKPNIRRTLNVVLTSPLRALGELNKFKAGVAFGKECKECM